MESIQDPRFGTFKHDPILETYQVQHQGVWLEIESVASLPHLRRVFDRLEDECAQAAAHAAQHLLKQKNTQLPDLDSGSKPVSISAEEFAGRLRLESYSVGDDASDSFSFDDGGLFFGHIVNVGRNSDGVWSTCDWAG